MCEIMAQTDEACSNFLPKDFTSESDKLKLVDGASMGHEQYIII